MGIPPDKAEQTVPMTARVRLLRSPCTVVLEFPISIPVLGRIVQFLDFLALEPFPHYLGPYPPRCSSYGYFSHYIHTS
ncbi:MAG: hypothetical protein SWO11_18075 [Thermodesulfobacteriota bacterium]|nr:hypothetical protein [Thermodesulfobacteriota bacterium]